MVDVICVKRRCRSKDVMKVVKTLIFVIFVIVGCFQLNVSAASVKVAQELIIEEVDISDVEKGRIFQNIKYQQIHLTGIDKLDKLISVLNEEVKMAAIKFKDEHVDKIRDDYNRTQKDNCRWNYFQELKIIRNDDKYFSVLGILSVCHSLIPHGGCRLIGYNFDVTTGKKLRIFDLVEDKSSLKGNLMDMLQSMQKDLMEYYPETIKNYMEGKMNLCFTINNDDVIVYFQEYDIACYTKGIMSFSLNHKILKNDIFRRH